MILNNTAQFNYKMVFPDGSEQGGVRYSNVVSTWIVPPKPNQLYPQSCFITCPCLEEIKTNNCNNFCDFALKNLVLMCFLKFL